MNSTHFVPVADQTGLNSSQVALNQVWNHLRPMMDVHPRDKMVQGAKGMHQAVQSQEKLVVKCFQHQQEADMLSDYLSDADPDIDVLMGIITFIKQIPRQVYPRAGKNTFEHLAKIFSHVCKFIDARIQIEEFELYQKQQKEGVVQKTLLKLQSTVGDDEMTQARKLHRKKRGRRQLSYICDEAEEESE